MATKEITVEGRAWQLTADEVFRNRTVTEWLRPGEELSRALSVTYSGQQVTIGLCGTAAATRTFTIPIEAWEFLKGT